MHDNMLSGTLPTTIGSLVALEELRIQRNSFAGQLPTEMGNMISLK